MKQFIFDALDNFPTIQKFLFKEKFETQEKVKAQLDEMHKASCKVRHEALKKRMYEGHNIRVERKRLFKKLRKENERKGVVFPRKHIGLIIDGGVITDAEWGSTTPLLKTNYGEFLLIPSELNVE